MSVLEPGEDMSPGNLSRLLEEEQVEVLDRGESALFNGRAGDRFVQVLSDYRGKCYVPALIDSDERGLSVEEKIDRIEEITEAQDDFGFCLPEIIHRDRDYLESEYVDGKTVEDYFSHKSSGEAEELALELGEGLRELHEEGWSIRDFAPENLVIDEVLGNEEIYIVDAEFSKQDAGKVDRAFDVMSFLYNIEVDSQQKYSAIAGSFSEGYGLSGTAENLMHPAIGLQGALLDQEYGKAARHLRHTLE